MVLLILCNTSTQNQKIRNRTRKFPGHTTPIPVTFTHPLKKNPHHFQLHSPKRLNLFQQIIDLTIHRNHLVQFSFQNTTYFLIRHGIS